MKFCSKNLINMRITNNGYFILKTNRFIKKPFCKKCGEPFLMRIGSPTNFCSQICAQSGKKMSEKNKLKSKERFTKNNPLRGVKDKKHPSYKHGQYKSKSYIRTIKRKSEAKRNAKKLNQLAILNVIERNRINFIYEVASTMANVQVDHIQPLNKGGLHHPDNLQILDRSLNAQKNNKWPLSEEETKKYQGYKL